MISAGFSNRACARRGLLSRIRPCESSVTSSADCATLRSSLRVSAMGAEVSFSSRLSHSSAEYKLTHGSSTVAAIKLLPSFSRSLTGMKIRPLASILYSNRPYSIIPAPFRQKSTAAHRLCGKLCGKSGKPPHSPTNVGRVTTQPNYIQRQRKLQEQILIFLIFGENFQKNSCVKRRKSCPGLSARTAFFASICGKPPFSK